MVRAEREGERREPYHFGKRFRARDPLVFDQHEVIFLRLRQRLCGGRIAGKILFLNQLILLSLLLAVFHRFDQPPLLVVAINGVLLSLSV